MKKIIITWEEAEKAAKSVAEAIAGYVKDKPVKIFGIPNGGICAAILVQGFLRWMEADSCLVETPEEANVFIDDHITTGNTERKWKEKYPDVGFFSLYEETTNDIERVFPWNEKEGCTCF